jgi:hypothetical protein
LEILWVQRNVLSSGNGMAGRSKKRCFQWRFLSLPLGFLTFLAVWKVGEQRKKNQLLHPDQIIELNGRFSIATFDCQRVSSKLNWLCLKIGYSLFQWIYHDNYHHCPY